MQQYVVNFVLTDREHTSVPVERHAPLWMMGSTVTVRNTFYLAFDFTAHSRCVRCYRSPEHGVVELSVDREMI